MNAEIIFVGDQLSNENSTKLVAEKLQNNGAKITAETAVEADAVKLKKALKTATDRSQLIVIVGGIGIGADDITVKTVCDAIGAEAVCDQTVLANIADRYAAMGEELPDGAFRGAILPKGAKAFYGEKGNMGCAITAGEQCIVMLPADEASLNLIAGKDLVPLVQSMIGKASYSCTFYGVDVSREAEQELANEVGTEQGVSLSVNRKDGEVTVVLTTIADSEEDARLKGLAVAVKVRGVLGDCIYTEEEKTIEQVTVDLLRQQGKTVATAESCTAGLLSKRLTDVSGSSDVFSMGIAAYSADIKAKVLSVPKELIEQKGTVSLEVAESMAVNVRRLSGCTYGIGITGVAGDSFEEKPSGLVYVSLTDGKTVWTKELNVDTQGSDARTTVRNTAATIALDMLRRALLGIAEAGEPLTTGGISFDADKGDNNKPSVAGNLSFVESAVQMVETEGVVEDGIILPAEETYTSYEEVDAAMFIGAEDEESEQLNFDFELNEEEEKIEQNAQQQDEILSTEDFNEVETDFMDEDFVIKEGAELPEEELEAEPEKKKKANGFIGWIKNFIPWKGDTLSKILTKCLFIVIIVSLVVSSCYVGDFMVKYFQNKSIVDDARDKYDRNDDSIDTETGVFNRFEQLLEQNSDCIGWVTVPNTNVDNPVYQTVDNDFYLTHNSIKENSVYGAVFADYRDIISRAGNTKNITLYGHHMKDGSMFAQLHRYKNISFYKENPVVTFDTVYGTGGQYKVIACMITNADNMDDNGYFFDFATPSFRSDADFMSWIEQIRRRSLYNTAVDVNASDEILTLSTCTYEVKSVDLLCVVVARKVRDGESVAVNTGDVTTNNKIIYPQAWYDHFGGVKPTYADGLYTWVSGDYDRENVNAPGSIAPESVASDAPVSSEAASSEAPVSSEAPAASTEPPVSTEPPASTESPESTESPASTESPSVEAPHAASVPAEFLPAPTPTST